MPIIPDRETYNQLKALNFSGSKELLKAPAFYQAYLNNPREETKALRMGSLTHALVLESDAVSARYAVLPEGLDRRTKEGKLAFEAFSAGAAGKKIVPADEWEVCKNVSLSMLAAKKSLGIEFTATELMLTVEYAGIQLKSAIDAVGSDGFLYDLKTSEDCGPRGWLQSCRQYKYNLQQHFYRLVYETETKTRVRGFRFIVAEKQAPWAWSIYELGPELAAWGVADFEAAVKAYKSATALDEWPGYPTEVQVIDVAGKTTPSNPINFA